MENEPTTTNKLSAETALLKNKVAELENYKLFFKNAPLPYQSLDNEGNFIDINPSWLDILGYKREDVIGKSFSDFLDTEGKNVFEKNFSVFKKQCRVHDVRFKIRHSDGHFINISLDGNIEFCADENAVQTYCIFHDITSKVKVEKELIETVDREHILAEIVRNSPVAVAFGYPDGTLGFANKAYEELTGYTSEELRTINWNQVLTPAKWRELEAEKLQELKPDKNYARYEKEYIHKSGKVIPIELNVKAKFENEELMHFIGFVTDITERKRVEDELDRYRKNLEKLVKERTTELQKKNKELDNTLKVFVGREMQIKYLQEKVKALGGKL